MTKRYCEYTPEQKKKASARSYAYIYLNRGKIKRQPCNVCGGSKAEMHHEDYSKPTVITWLCRKCHIGRHNLMGTTK